MPDLESLSRRTLAPAAAADRLVQVARSVQRVVVVRAGRGAPLEAIARQIHAASARSSQALVLLDAERMEHDDSVSTAVESARRGTLGLLRPHRASPRAQARLTEWLRRVRRAVDGAPRVLALFDADPRALNASSELDAALLEALDGLWLNVPPLSDRSEAIGELAEATLARLDAAARLAPEALAVLERLPWPGGERELELWLQRALLLADGGPLLAEHVAPPSGSLARGDAGALADGSLVVHGRNLAAVEAALIRRVLEEQDGNVSRCAAVLGIHRSTLHAKLRSLRRR